MPWGITFRAGPFRYYRRLGGAQRRTATPQPAADGSNAVDAPPLTMAVIAAVVITFAAILFKAPAWLPVITGFVAFVLVIVVAVQAIRSQRKDTTHE